MSSDIRNLLQYLPLFKDVSPEVIDGLIAAGIERAYMAGEVIIQEGSLGRDMYLIIEGKVQVIKGENGGEQRELAIREPGDLIGEMGLIEGTPRFATVIALEATRVLEFSEQDLRSLWAKQPLLLYRVVSMLSHRLRESDLQMIADLHHKNVELARAYHDLKEAQDELLEKERLERELELARDLQQRILPDSFPDIPRLDISAKSCPARQVGGDFYDVIPLGTHRVGLVIADVSDKGMPAALFMSLTRSLIRAESRRSTSPRAILMTINQLLLEMSHSDMFVTVFFGLLDLSAGFLRYARAGHDRPIHLNTISGKSQLLGGKGMALGVIDKLDLEEFEIEVHQGEILILYTDGITDATSPDSPEFGLDGLQKIVKSHHWKGASELCDAILEDVVRFQDGTPQFDDMAILCAIIN